MENTVAFRFLYSSPPTPERWATSRTCWWCAAGAAAPSPPAATPAVPCSAARGTGFKLVGTVLGGLTLADGDSIALVLTITPELLAELRRLGYEPFLS